VLPFGAMPVGEFLGMIDFFIYFTSPTWRESFGRAIAEAIVAGKVVIADAAVAEVYGEAVIAARPDEVDEIVAAFVAEPYRYSAQVARAQEAMSHWSAEAFRDRVAGLLQGEWAVAE
jgi:hypothetical protein